MSYIKNLTDPSAMAALLTNISRNQKTKSDLIERLSSGVVIHSGGSLALSQALNADKKLASVAIQNINEGISLVQVRDDGIEAIQDVLQKQKELASMAASGALDNNQRSVYNQEFQELTTLMQNITNDTKYNDINLLSEAKEIRLQAGLEGQSAIANNPNQLLIGTDNFYEDSVEGQIIKICEPNKSYRFT